MPDLIALFIRTVNLVAFIATVLIVAGGVFK